MKEITITYKAEVTKIVKVENDEQLLRGVKDVEREVKDDLGVDDVHISKLKYFIIDEKEDS